jgi:hypothetical protein
MEIERRKIKRLPPSGKWEIDKKYAWIVFVEDENGITDLEVYECRDDDEYTSSSTKTYHRVDVAMRGIHYGDIGCSYADWDLWDLQDIMFIFGFQIGFSNAEIRKQTIMKLGKIIEFRTTIMEYIEVTGMFSENEIPEYLTREYLSQFEKNSSQLSISKK